MSDDKTLSIRKIALIIGVYGLILFLFPLLMHLIFAGRLDGSSNRLNVPFMLLTVNVPTAMIQSTRRIRLRVFLISIIPLLAFSVGGNAFWSYWGGYEVDWGYAMFAYSVSIPIVAMMGLFVIMITSMKIHRNV